MAVLSLDGDPTEVNVDGHGKLVVFTIVEGGRSTKCVLQTHLSKVLFGSYDSTALRNWLAKVCFSFMSRLVCVPVVLTSPRVLSNGAQRLQMRLSNTVIRIARKDVVKEGAAASSSQTLIAAETWATLLHWSQIIKVRCITAHMFIDRC